ncbi:MAG: type II toxin-antitoxin system HicA family toxin, partial [Methylobacter sp.]
MKSVSGKHFARILESRGWTLIRVNGSHHVYMQPGNSVR